MDLGAVRRCHEENCTVLDVFGVIGKPLTPLFTARIHRFCKEQENFKVEYIHIMFGMLAKAGCITDFATKTTIAIVSKCPVSDKHYL